jgi:hypothetical protein
MDDSEINYFAPSRSFLPQDSLKCFDFNPLTDLNDDEDDSENDVDVEEEYYEEEILLFDEDDEIIEEIDEEEYLRNLGVSSTSRGNGRSYMSSNSSTGSGDYSYYTVADLSTIMEQGESQCTSSVCESLDIGLDSSKHSRRSTRSFSLHNSSRHQRTTGPSLLAKSNSYRQQSRSIFSSNSMVGEEICCDFDEEMQGSGIIGTLALSASSHHRRQQQQYEYMTSIEDVSSHDDSSSADDDDTFNGDDDDDVTMEGGVTDLYSKHTVSTCKSSSLYSKLSSSSTEHSCSTHDATFNIYNPNTTSLFQRVRPTIAFLVASKLLQKCFQQLQDMGRYPKADHPSPFHTRWLAFESAKSELLGKFESRMSHDQVLQYREQLDTRHRLLARAKRQLGFFVARHKKLEGDKLKSMILDQQRSRLLQRSRSRRSLASAKSMTSTPPTPRRKSDRLPSVCCASPRSVAASSPSAAAASPGLHQKRVQRARSEQKLRSVVQQHLNSSFSDVAASEESTKRRPPQRSMSMMISSPPASKLQGFALWKQRRQVTPTL